MQDAAIDAIDRAAKAYSELAGLSYADAERVVWAFLQCACEQQGAEGYQHIRFLDNGQVHVITDQVALKKLKALSFVDLTALTGLATAALAAYPGKPLLITEAAVLVAGVCLLREVRKLRTTPVSATYGAVLRALVVGGAVCGKDASHWRKQANRIAAADGHRPLSKEKFESARTYLKELGALTRKAGAWSIKGDAVFGGLA